MILLCAAVEIELRWWRPRPSVDVLFTGVGSVEAGCRVAHALAQGRYRVVVNAGVAGAFDGMAHVGDGVVVGNEMMELDLESGTALEMPDGERLTSRTRSDGVLGAGRHGRGFPVLNGITVNRVTATDATAQRLAGLGAQVESMEGYAVLRAAELANVPAIELRGISNRVGERSQSGWDIAAGIAGLERVTHDLFAVLEAVEKSAPHA